MQEYPDFRAGNPPEFLDDQYETTTGLFRHVARYRGIHNDKLNAASLSEQFPDFNTLFEATGGELQDAIDSALDNEAKIAPEEFRAATERHLLFEDVEEVKNVVKGMMKHKIEDLPRELSDLEVGNNPGDVIDPFLVALDMELLSVGQNRELVQNMVTHKCLMKFEDLMGHVHEEVLGRAAGCKMVAEPSGENKHEYHPEDNPYPGTDTRRGEDEFFQIKNKTGSEKGGAGARIGQQLNSLGEQYPGCERYYVSVVGQTLKGHRSKGAILREDPDTEVLVGLTAIQQIGRHQDTPRILLEFYLEEFEEAADEADFKITDIIDNIVEEWEEKYGEEDPLQGLLYWATVGDPRQQTSETYDPYRDTVDSEDNQTTLEQYAPSGD